MLISVLNGLKKLHAKKIIHRDLKVTASMITLEREHIYRREGHYQDWGSQRVQSFPRRLVLYTNRHPILRQPWDMERPALWHKVRHLVIRLRHLLDDLPETPLLGLGHVATIQIRHQRHLQPHPIPLLHLVKRHPPPHATSRPSRTSISRSPTS